MIVMDNETTGLLGVSILPREQQPSVIEFAAVRLDYETLEEVGRLTFMVKPPILPLSDEVVKITGIRTEDLVDKRPFVAHAAEVAEFFLGARHLVAHNLAFDREILALEYRRLGRELQFPWPPEHHCTVELTSDITGKNMKQSDLYLHYTGNEAHQTHRALDDVLQLVEIIRHMRSEGRI